jgi:exo-rhamnogalacturonan lyase-like protein
MIKTAALLSLVLCACLSVHGGEELKVPLEVNEPVGVARDRAAVTGGVPVGPLAIKDVKDLVLVDEHGVDQAAQITPMVKREDGVLLWVLVDTLTSLKPGGTARYFLTRRKAAGKVAAPRRPVTTRQDDEHVSIENGLIKVTISKQKFDLLEMVWIDRDADGKFADTEKALDAERGSCLAITRVKDGAVFDSRSGKVERVVLEDSGAVRSTVRVDGSFGKAAGDGGEEWLKYTARVTLWAGSREVRVLYSIRNVNSKAVEHAHIKRAAVNLKLVAPAGRQKHYLLGTRQVHLGQISTGGKDAVKGSQWHNAVEMTQVGPPSAVTGKSHRRFYKLVNFKDAGYRVIQYQPGKRKPTVDVGFKCDGWVDLAGENGGALVWLRNFTHDCPKRLRARADGRIEVEVIPEYAGKDQPYYRDGGYWLGDRSHRSYELSFFFHARPLISAADWKKYVSNYVAYIAATPETAAKASALIQGFRHRLQLVSTPQWYTRSGALWGVMPTLKQEDAAARAMGWKTPGPVHQYHVGKLAEDFLHYENFHYRSEWDEPRDTLVEFLRTRDWGTFMRGHSFARNYRDLGVWRTDGQQLGERTPWKGPKRGAWAIPRWGKFCGCHHYGAGLIDFWLLTGDRSYMQAGVEWGRQCAVTKAYGGFGNRHWGRRMAATLRAYQVTRDPELKAFLIKWGRPPTPTDAQRADGRALLCGKKMASWMAGLCTHAIWHNYVEFRGEYKGADLDDYEDGIIGLARQVANYWWNPATKSGPYHFLIDGAGPGKVKFTGGGPDYSATCIDTMTRGYLLTGDKHLLAAARKYWQNVNGEAGVQRARLQDFYGMGSHGYWARQLVYELANPRKDSTPPEAINDLAAEALGGGRVKLTWTAPKDDSGKAARYQLKHAPASFCVMRDYKFPDDHGKKWTWWAGYNVSGEPVPNDPGKQQSVTVTGIPAGKRFFCLRSRDASNNESALGKIVELDVK